MVVETTELLEPVWVRAAQAALAVGVAAVWVPSQKPKEAAVQANCRETRRAQTRPQSATGCFVRT